MPPPSGHILKQPKICSRSVFPPCASNNQKNKPQLLLLPNVTTFFFKSNFVIIIFREIFEGLTFTICFRTFAGQITGWTVSRVDWRLPKTDYDPDKGGVWQLMLQSETICSIVSSHTYTHYSHLYVICIFLYIRSMMNIYSKQPKSCKIHFEQKPFHWEQLVTLGDLPCCAKMACCPWWPWRSRAANRESQGAGPRRQSGTMSPKAQSLGFKTTKVRKSLFFHEEFFFRSWGGTFFFCVWNVFGVFPPGKKSGVLGKNNVFVAFGRKTWMFLLVTG